MVEFTSKYGLYKPDFNISGWHTQVNGNFDSIDSLIFAVLGLGNFVGEWTNSTNYTEQQRVFDPDDGTIWNCLVDHTSSATDSFADDRADNPSYWNSVSTIPIARGAWQNDTLYGAGDISYDVGESLIGIASATHTSSSTPNTMRDDAANWTFIADLSAVSVLVSSVNGQTGSVSLDADDIAETTRKYASAAQLAQIATNTGNITTAQTSANAAQTSANTAQAAADAAQADINALIIEGSWTPTLRFGGSTTGITYTTQVGRYLKVGNLVNIWGNIVLSNNGSATGVATIVGLPYATSVVTNLVYAGAVGSFFNIDGGGDGLLIGMNSGSSTIDLRVNEGAGNDDALDANHGANIFFQDVSGISFAITYRTG